MILDMKIVEVFADLKEYVKCVKMMLIYLLDWIKLEKNLLK